MESVLPLKIVYVHERRNRDAPSVQFTLRACLPQYAIIIVLAGDKVVTSPVVRYALILRI